MKTMQMTLAALLVSSGQAFAASASAGQDSGLMTWLFLGFFALIVVAQLVPGLLILGSVIKGLASSGSRAESASQ